MCMKPQSWWTVGGLAVVMACHDASAPDLGDPDFSSADGGEYVEIVECWQDGDGWESLVIGTHETLPPGLEGLVPWSEALPVYRRRG